jgi:hypothetical protein
MRHEDPGQRRFRADQRDQKDRDMTSRTGTSPLRLPLSLKAAVDAISERDGASMSQFLAAAAAEKIAAMQTETFFAERTTCTDRAGVPARAGSLRRRSAAGG